MSKQRFQCPRCGGKRHTIAYGKAYCTTGECSWSGPFENCFVDVAECPGDSPVKHPGTPGDHLTVAADGVSCTNAPSNAEPGALGDTPAITFEVGDLIQAIPPWALVCGSGLYDRAVLVSITPFVAVSESGDMMWSATITPGKVLRIGKALPSVLNVAMARFARDFIMEADELCPGCDCIHGQCDCDNCLDHDSITGPETWAYSDMPARLLRHDGREIGLSSLVEMTYFTKAL